MASTQLRTEVREGSLVIFPSWLEHYVEPWQHASPRIMVSFNALVDRVPEDRQTPTQAFYIPRRHAAQDK
jgi:hypothetical protein